MNKAFALLLLASWAFAEERKPPPWEKPAASGRDLFRGYCIVCHEIENPESEKLGPSLYRFFQNEKTPLTRIPPSEKYMLLKIQAGGKVMPAFKSVLTRSEIDQIIAYIRTKKFELADQRKQRTR